MQPGNNQGGAMGKSKRKASREELRFFLKHFIPYLKTERLAFIFIIIFVFLATGFQLVGPLIVSTIIDDYIIAGHYQDMLGILIVLVGTYFFSSIFYWLQETVLARIVARMVAAIRADVYQKLQTLPMSYFDQKSFGSIMSNLTNDLDNLYNALSTATTQILSSVLLVVGSLGLMFYQNVWLALATLVTVPLTFFLSKIVSERANKHMSKQQEQIGEINAYAEENLNSTILIKAYGKEQVSKKAFDQLADNYYQSNFMANFYSGLMMTVVILMNNLNVVILAILGGGLAFAGLLQVGVISSFMQYQRQFTRPLGTLAGQFMMIQLAIVSGAKVMKIFEEESESKPAQAIEKVSLKKSLQIKNLDFSYLPGKKVLRQINFVAKAGQMVALVGPTGSGKTTLANLLLRFYDPERGEILFDDQDIALAERKEIRDLIGVVLQEVNLFSGSVADNIRLGKSKASMTEVEEAAKKAHAHDFITHLEDGYKTQINPSATNLSQGQQQLLAIARAFLLDPPALILDEATSNVDTLTEYAIQQAMQKLLAGRLSLVIAHRLSTVKNADIILVMRDGQIVESGSHSELLAQKGFYAQIYHSQDADLLVG